MLSSSFLGSVLATTVSAVPFYGLNSRTWTSSASIDIAAKVADGYSGVMIAKPIKTRKCGRVLKGCIGLQTEASTFLPIPLRRRSAGIKSGNFM
ncbi:hypothetical protein N0V84_006158 [Fusarium piperis]|uniref:Secreted protein n=1 Tax=Fusarium piperis TaxID=1435070 RepID=A0A9W8WCP9_9HYPO|nr:hypothetical protein N0V84_006158 [Fusarium piperis]